MFIMRNKFLLPLIFTMIYLALPSANSGIDGYAYAASIQWGKDLIWPHHLLYCYFGYWLHWLVPSIESLALMKIVNAIGGGLSLMVLQAILKRLKVNNASYFIAFVAASFGFMRFATENETYILPILFSLGGTLLYLRFLNTHKNTDLVFSGILLGTGVLFHQIHALWYLGFILSAFLDRKEFNWKQKILFAGTGGLLIAGSYILVYTQQPLESAGSFIQFLFNDVYAGRVQTGITLSNFLMTPVSFIRTFLQVHGYMWQMFIDTPALFILPLSFLMITFIAIKTMIQHSKIQKPDFPIFTKAVLFACILHFIFAFYSVGNAEFMVMLPFLLVIWLVTKVNLTTKPVLYLSLIMFAWNIVFGLAPAHFLDLDGSKQILTLVQKNPKDIWVLKEPQKIENMAAYYGNPSLETTILREDELSFHVQQNKSFDGQIVFTDIIDSREGINRQGFLHRKRVAAMDNFQIKPVDTLFFYGGKRVISILKSPL